MDNKPAAEQTYKNGVAALPKDPWMRFELGEYYLLENQADSARVHYQNAQELDPKFLPVQRRMALLLLLDGQVEASEDMVKAVVSG